MRSVEPQSINKNGHVENVPHEPQRVAKRPLERDRAVACDFADLLLGIGLDDLLVLLGLLGLLVVLLAVVAFSHGLLLLLMCGTGDGPNRPCEGKIADLPIDEKTFCSCASMQVCASQS